MFLIHGCRLREWINIFVRPVVMLQKGADNHGRGVPPDGVSDEHGVVFLQVDEVVSCLRNGGAGVLLCLFLRSAVGHVVIAAHIRLFGYDLNEIAARSFGNVFRHMLCVLRARPREVYHESVAVGIARRVGRLRFRRVAARIFIVAVGLGTVLSVVAARLLVARLRIVIGGRIGAGGKSQHRHAQYKAQKNN